MVPVRMLAAPSSAQGKCSGQGDQSHFRNSGRAKGGSMEGLLEVEGAGISESPLEDSILLAVTAFYWQYP